MMHRHPSPISSRFRTGPQVVRAAAGFTLLEILTVIGIIATLSAIVAIAFHVVGNNAAARRTRVAIETCMSLQKEYEDAAGSLPSTLKTSSASAVDLDANVSPGLDPTARIAILARTVPANREAEDKMSANSVEMITWTPLAWVTGTNYSKGDYVTYLTVTYIALNNMTPSATAPSTDTANWATSSVPTPIVVPTDGWGKGMRFVGGALTNVTIIDSTGAHVARPNVASPNGRPFWVSAGPDGLFATHDDNVYSFEN